jgi:tetratricopeptide (TPR) repeat protein
MRYLSHAYILLLFMAGSALAQSNTIRGKVRSTNGSTVNNAIVDLRVNGGGMLGQTVTRNDGDFAFSGLEPGEYEISIQIAGYEPAIQMARIEGGMGVNYQQVVNIEVLIRPKPDSILGSTGTNFVQEVPKAARAAFEKAQEKLRDGKAQEGVELLKQAVALFADYFDAHLTLGLELFKLGQDNEALQELERARQINDREGAVYHLFGLIMLKEKKFGVAEYAFSEATRLGASNPVSRFYHGLALLEVAKSTPDQQLRSTGFADAEKELDRAIELSGGRLATAYLQRARVYESRGNYEAAARDLETYLKAEPDAENAPALREAITRLRARK